VISIVGQFTTVNYKSTVLKQRVDLTQDSLKPDRTTTAESGLWSLDLDCTYLANYDRTYSLPVNHRDMTAQHAQACNFYLIFTGDILMF